MSLAKFFSNPYFQPRCQILQQKMNPVLKMLTELTQASQAFLILWEEDYQQLYDLNKNTHVALNIDLEHIKFTFSKLNQEAIYVPTIKYHTLCQNIDFFKSYVNNEQLLIYPILDSNDRVEGIVGSVLSSSDSNDFDILMKQMESIGIYTNQLFLDYLDNKKSSLPNSLNLENLPASFFEIEINQNNELLYSNFSKTLMIKHPAFEQECSAEKRTTKLLNMPIPDFFSLIKRIRNKQNMEYVYSCSDRFGEKKYFVIRLHISEVGNGHYRCLGVLEDFTLQNAYGSLLDQMVFDISHVMRRPVVTMKGLTNLIEMEKCEKADLKEIADKIKTVSEEMEEYIKAMFKIYEAKQAATYHL